MEDTTTRTVQEWARIANSHFTTAQRGDETIIVKRNDAPEWVTDLVYAAHHGFTDFLPDDYRYSWIASALECIAESDDPEDAAHKFADAQTDIYTGNLLRWLASNLNRVSYVDEMVREMGIEADEGIERMISAGQYEEIRETYSLVLQFLEGLTV